jgi:hypothetical protein
LGRLGGLQNRSGRGDEEKNSQLPLGIERGDYNEYRSASNMDGRDCSSFKTIIHNLRGGNEETHENTIAGVQVKN